MEAEKERFRTSILSSVTHDLQTPLAAIMGSASSILAGRQPPSASVSAMAENTFDET